MAANRTARVKKKQKYTVDFHYTIFIIYYIVHITKSYKLNSTKMTNNKSYKLKHPKNN